MKPRLIALAALSSLAVLIQAPASAGAGNDARLLERGKYLARIGGCNDCHTPGFAESGGNTPTQQWLTGSPVGFQGPWGTTYPANLRLYVRDMSESQWLARVRKPMGPPMPWFNLRDMPDKDLIALYRFIRALGPAGEAAPQAAAPGVAASTPYIEFVPNNLPLPTKHAQR